MKCTLKTSEVGIWAVKMVLNSFEPNNIYITCSNGNKYYFLRHIAIYVSYDHVTRLQH
jgi:hypothetical protein